MHLEDVSMKKDGTMPLWKEGNIILQHLVLGTVAFV
jgi:hypothetical protein